MNTQRMEARVKAKRIAGAALFLSPFALLVVAAFVAGGIKFALWMAVFFLAVIVAAAALGSLWFLAIDLMLTDKD